MKEGLNLSGFLDPLDVCILCDSYGLRECERDVRGLVRVRHDTARSDQ
jgi:hypothetical protein